MANNFFAHRPPTGADPAIVGDTWVLRENNRRYTCIDVVAGTSIWDETLLAGCDHYLPDFLKDDLFWKEMVEVIDVVRDKEVDRPISEIRKLRDAANLSTEWKIKTAKLIGVDINNLQMTDSEYQRILEFLVLFKPEKGTAWVQRFLSFIKSLDVQLVQQWTNDHIVFQDTVPETQKLPQFSPVGVGTQYLSTRFVMRVTEPQGINTTFNMNNFTPQKLMDLFYLFGPLTVVIDVRLNYVVSLPTTYVIMGGFQNKKIMGNILG